MSSKGRKQGKKNTANTIGLKTRIPGECTQESRQFFFVFFAENKRGMDRQLVKINYLLV